MNCNAGRGQICSAILLLEWAAFGIVGSLFVTD